MIQFTSQRVDTRTSSDSTATNYNFGTSYYCSSRQYQFGHCGFTHPKTTLGPDDFLTVIVERFTLAQLEIPTLQSPWHEVLIVHLQALEYWLVLTVLLGVL